MWARLKLIEGLKCPSVCHISCMRIMRKIALVVAFCWACTACGQQLQNTTEPSSKQAHAESMSKPVEAVARFLLAFNSGANPAYAGLHHGILDRRTRFGHRAPAMRISSAPADKLELELSAGVHSKDSASGWKWPGQHRAATAAAALLLGMAAPGAAGAAAEALSAAEIEALYGPSGLPTITAKDTAIFLWGCFPFLWATQQFWTRIVSGKSFGTGSERVIINATQYDELIVKGADPDQLRRRGGRTVLGQDAMYGAYVLFTVAGLAALFTFYTVYETLTATDIAKP
mmetsp:Transcript_92181/g.176743  ORF Transcript_92181/g.176743 Transcript_92181/m.176743 type:complete len:287 (+) Transcript_92181:1-861(+)